MKLDGRQVSSIKMRLQLKVSKATNKQTKNSTKHKQTQSKNTPKPKNQNPHLILRQDMLIAFLGELGLNWYHSPKLLESARLAITKEHISSVHTPELKIHSISKALRSSIPKLLESARLAITKEHISSSFGIIDFSNNLY
jgi:hypothetical protein